MTVIFEMGQKIGKAIFIEEATPFTNRACGAPFCFFVCFLFFSRTIVHPHKLTYAWVRSFVLMSFYCMQFGVLLWTNCGKALTTSPMASASPNRNLSRYVSPGGTIAIYLFVLHIYMV